MFGFIKKLFHKKTNEELEAEMAEELITESENELDNVIGSTDIPASVITYLQADDEEIGASIAVLYDNFKAAVMPEPGSIIWCVTKEDGTLRPFKCLRFDYICNTNELESLRTYIVVEPATQSDILPNPMFVEDNF